MGLIDAWCHTTCKVKPRSSYTDGGEGSMGTAVTVRCVVRPHVRMVIDDKGQEARSEYAVYVPSGTTLAAGCTVSIDGGTTYRKAIQIVTHYGLDGAIDHYEVRI